MEMLTISNRALKLIARIMVSCRIFRNNYDQHDSYVIFRAKEGKDLNYQDFLKGIVGKSYLAIYEGLAAMAKVMDKDAIDTEAVCYFFGGKPHINKIKKILENPESRLIFPEEKRRMEFFLTHILLPVKITSKEGGIFRGEYANHERKIVIYDLIPFKEDKDNISIGQYVLTHFPSIISTNEDKVRLLRSRLLKEQLADNDLKRAIDILDGQEIHQKGHRKHIKETMELYDM